MTDLLSRAAEVGLTTKPSYSEPALPKRQGRKGLIPLSWAGRTMKVSYTDAYGGGVESSGTLLDIYPTGPVLNLNGAMTMLSWDRLVLLELRPDR